jgi:bifunctional UDP-N-acetylglucosamine pyrophosphorylase / glucosamine-1-phosphate N-acetyltransferase
MPMSEGARWVAIILAAGQGTRMRSRLPKVAHKIAGRPIVRHVVECARAAGVDQCVVVVSGGEDAAAVRAAAGDDVRFAVQDQQHGTGHAVEQAREAAGDADCVLILNGDVPLVQPASLRRLMAAVAADDAPHPAAPDLALLTALVPVEAYGVLNLTPDMRITAINETKGSEGIDRAESQYINSGQYAVRARWLWPRLARIAPAANGERYLTALAAMAHDEGNAGVAVVAEAPIEVRGINDRVHLAEAESAMRDRIRRGHMLNGVTMMDPASTFIDAGVGIGQDTTIEANTHLQGATTVGEACVIGPGAVIRDSTIGDRCVVRQSTIEESTLEAEIDVGPYSHLRPGSYLCSRVHIGNFAEVKASRLGRGTKMGHFSYIGDAEVGDDVNIGAGTITANYDGTKKSRTVIDDGAFIGSDTMLVAPVRIGRGARTAAGSVVTKDVPDGMMAIGSPARIRGRAGDGEADAGQ